MQHKKWTINTAVTITENIYHTGVTALLIVIKIKYRYKATKADLECSGQQVG